MSGNRTTDPTRFLAWLQEGPEIDGGALAGSDRRYQREFGSTEGSIEYPSVKVLVVSPGIGARPATDPRRPGKHFVPTSPSTGRVSTVRSVSNENHAAARV